MRILPLNRSIQTRILSARRASDRAAEPIAARIIADVRKRGDAALFAFTKKFDGIEVDAKSIWVSASDMRTASKHISRDFLEAIDHAAANIRAVAQKQRPPEWTIEVESGVRVGQIVRPLDSVGCYLPGGRFSLASTLLMTVIPAQVAGVKRIVAVSPQPGAALLAAAERLGVERVARVGGAQAIAALAYGTKSIERVDKICGPGNRFVAAAKRLVSNDCSIDMLAGPTEAIVFATNGNAEFIAADLIAQAEHDSDAVCVFVTVSSRLARAVAKAVESQLVELPKTSIARRSLASNGAILVAKTAAEGVRFVNAFAPEHLTIAGDIKSLLSKIDSAGSIFIGDWSAQTFGDYATGTNHVLPTAGVARTRGGLSVADFVKCIGVQRVSRSGFARLAPVAAEFAKAENLPGHARSIEVRR